MLEVPSEAISLLQCHTVDHPKPLSREWVRYLLAQYSGLSERSKTKLHSELPYLLGLSECNLDVETWSPDQTLFPLSERNPYRRGTDSSDPRYALFKVFIGTGKDRRRVFDIVAPLQALEHRTPGGAYSKAEMFLGGVGMNISVDRQTGALDVLSELFVNDSPLSRQVEPIVHAVWNSESWTVLRAQIDTQTGKPNAIRKIRNDTFSEFSRSKYFPVTFHSERVGSVTLPGGEQYQLLFFPSAGDIFPWRVVNTAERSRPIVNKLPDEFMLRGKNTRSR